MEYTEGIARVERDLVGGELYILIGLQHIATVTTDINYEANAARIVEAWNNWHEAKSIIDQMSKMILYDDVYPEGTNGHLLATRAKSFIAKLS